MSQSGAATTGPDNPLNTFTPKEAQDLEKAQKESDVAYVEYKKMKDAYTKAQHDGTSEEEVIGFRGKMYDLEEEARTKEQTLRGLQDFCD